MPDARLDEPPVAGASTVVLTVLSVVRMIQVASWPAAIITGGTTGLRFPDLAWAVWAVAAGVTVVVLLSLWFLRRLVTALAILDIGVAVLSLLVGGFLTRPAHGTDFNHPALAMAIGTATDCGIVLAIQTHVIGGRGACNCVRDRCPQDRLAGSPSTHQHGRQCVAARRPAHRGRAGGPPCGGAESWPPKLRCGAGEKQATARRAGRSRIGAPTSVPDAP